MSFSERSHSELDYAVFTNSESDYRITSISARMPPEVRGVLDGIARACEAWVAAEAGTAAGVIPLPPTGGRLFAFRLFDVGPYRGRPHTLGIVGVLVPPAEQRNWAIGDVLAALPAPVPGADQYALPSAAQCHETSPLTSPFADLVEWERSHPNGVTEKVCCSSPPGFHPLLPDWPEPQGEGACAQKGRRIAVVLALALAAAVALGVVLYAVTGKPPGSGDGETPAGLDSEDKKKIQGSLEGIVPAGSWSLSPAAATDVLRERVITVADEARSRMRDLGDAIQKERGRDREPNFLQVELEVAIGKWTRIDPGPMESTGLPPDIDRVRKAIRVLGEYRLIRQQLKLLADADIGSSAFREGVQRLLGDLSRAVAL